MDPPGVVRRVAGGVTGRRGRWVTIAAWVAIAIAGLVGHSHIDQVTAAGQSSFLPSHAESTKVVGVLQHDYRGSGDDVPAIIVFQRHGGLSERDIAEIGHLAHGLDRLAITGATPVIAPFSPRSRKLLTEVATFTNGIGPIARDGEAALAVLAINAGDRGAIESGVHQIRAYLRQHRPAGLQTYVTGPAGIAADLEQVAEDAGKTLLIATLGLVLVLLLIVYRAPILALTPLLVVGAAYLVSIGITYLLIDADAITVNAEGTFLLLVLIFGAGTDYSLLLVHRYREELGAGLDSEAALRAALAKSVRPIAASGGTVIAAVLVLLLAELESTHWLGPVLAIGIAVMLAAAFTLLPALLAVSGRRAFWPAEHGAASPGDDPRWTRVAGLVRRRSGTIIVAVCAGLLVLTAGNLLHHGTIGFGQGETRPTESGRGTKVLNEHFPPGIGSPLTLAVEAGRLEAAQRSVENLDTVKLTIPVPAAPGSGEAVIGVVLKGNPYGSRAADDVEGIRDALHQVDPGGLVGGIPAENYDVEQTNTSDTRLIVPIVLLLIGLILGLLLRSIAAPAYLIVTVVASLAATLGLVTFLFTQVFDSSGLAFNLVLLSFIFLVALGVDYNIFLMSRAREEAALHGTREGALIALVNTGAVVTGAGLVLAGTFATLTLLPLEELIQVGATVALGVLLDTFVVRALLIPAITYRLGDRAWWPSRPESRRRRS